MKYCILILFAFTITVNSSTAQCGFSSDKPCTSIASTGFNFLKTFKIEKKEKDFIEYSYVFTKGTQYLLNLCNNSQVLTGIVVTLYDSNRNKIASNKVGENVITGMTFPCQSTGIYYMQYTFEKGASECGGSVLAFKR